MLSRVGTILFWKNHPTRTNLRIPLAQEEDRAFSEAVILQRENDRVHFETTIARMARGAAEPALGKNYLAVARGIRPKPRFSAPTPGWHSI
jgi:hypothetical protein